MKNRVLSACACGALFLLLIVLVRAVDVAAIGPAGTSVGLSHVNGPIHRALGYSALWYRVSEALGGLTLLVAAAFAVLGIFQLVRGRSLAKVDRELIALGGLYAAVAVLYIFFDKVAVNYRPVLMPGEASPEASFPSSHAMLVCTVMGSAMMLADRYAPRRLVRPLRIACGAVIAVTVAGRMISGVHWFTDILGGALISAALLLAFSAALRKYGRKRRGAKRA